MFTEDLLQMNKAGDTEFSTHLIPDLVYIDDFLTADEEAKLRHGIDQYPNAWRILRNRRLQNWGGLPHIKGMIPVPLPPFLKSIISKLDEFIFQAHVHTRPNHVLINHYEPGEGIHAHVDGPAYQPCAAILSLSAPIVMNFYPLLQPSDDTEAATATDTATKKDTATTTEKATTATKANTANLSSTGDEDSDCDINGTYKPICSLLLRPRSLLILKGYAYTHVRHGINPVLHDTIDSSVVNALPHEIGLDILRQQRTSLTVRASIRTISNPLLGRQRYK